MRLDDLLQPWIALNTDTCDITGVQNDSRRVQPGDLFIAYPGAVVDGRQFIDQAIQKGAAAIVFESVDATTERVSQSSVPCIPFPKLTQHLAALASRFYHDPSAQMSVTGVTGTNGKTTIAYQLAQAHQILGRPAMYIGTLGYGTAQNLHTLQNTTPDALELQRILYLSQQQGMNQVCMEVSSHALAQDRVEKIKFSEAIYTNLSHEHLDYHSTMQAYAAAKASLFAKSSLSWAIVNQDDEYVATMKAGIAKNVQVWTYGIEKPAEVRVVDYQLKSHETRFTVQSPWGKHDVITPLLGLFNIYNSLAVYTSLFAHHYSEQSVIEVMARLPATPGRMEIVAHNPHVIVDFAHTPAALDNVLKAVLRLKSSAQTKIWVVLGCGGDRDKTKRPVMGKIASEQADHVIVTSDNPRHEDPDAIIHDIAMGFVTGATIKTIVNRAEAIRYALDHAAHEDIVLIAGKGHEQYQIIGDDHWVFSDQEEVRQFFGD